MFVSVQKNLQHVDICTLRISTSFEYIVDTSEKTESLLSERIAEKQKVFRICYAIINWAYFSFLLEVNCNHSKQKNLNFVCRLSKEHLPGITVAFHG